MSKISLLDAVKMERSIDKWAAVILTIVLLLSIAGVLIGNVETEGDSLISSPCEAEGCYYNFTADACHVNETNTTECAYTAYPLAGMFGSGALIVFVIMAFLVIAIFGYVGLRVTNK